MSPEQAEGQLERLAPRSGVYILDATLYCLLTGRPPFAGDVVDVIRAVQKGDFRSRLAAAGGSVLTLRCLGFLLFFNGGANDLPAELISFGE